MDQPTVKSGWVSRREGLRSTGLHRLVYLVSRMGKALRARWMPVQQTNKDKIIKYACFVTDTFNNELLAQMSSRGQYHRFSQNLNSLHHYTQQNIIVFCIWRTFLPRVCSAPSIYVPAIFYMSPFLPTSSQENPYNIYIEIIVYIYCNLDSKVGRSGGSVRQICF